jgi:hypothetical protein
MLPDENPDTIIARKFITSLKGHDFIFLTSMLKPLSIRQNNINTKKLSNRICLGRLH